MLTTQSKTNKRLFFLIHYSHEKTSIKVDISKKFKDFLSKVIDMFPDSKLVFKFQKELKIKSKI